MSYHSSISWPWQLSNTAVCSLGFCQKSDNIFWIPICLKLSVLQKYLSPSTELVWFSPLASFIFIEFHLFLSTKAVLYLDMGLFLMPVRYKEQGRSSCSSPDLFNWSSRCWIIIHLDRHTSMLAKTCCVVYKYNVKFNGWMRFNRQSVNILSHLICLFSHRHAHEHAQIKD